MAYGIDSLKHAAQNIGGAFGVGYKAGVGEFNGIGKMMPFNIGSVGGILTAGGLGVAGAATGAFYNSISNEDVSPVAGAIGGGVIGAAALPVAGAMATTGYHIVTNLDKIGQAAFSVGKGVSKIGKGVLESFDNPNRFMNPLGHYAKAIPKIADKLVTTTPKVNAWNTEKGVMESKGGKMKITGWGKAALFGAAAIAGSMSAFNSYEQSRMGVMDNYISTNTPGIPSYNNNAGATGDLVFALNANRRG